MKIKLKELFRKKEDDLDLDLDEELNDPDIRIETYEMTEDPQAKEELWDKIKNIRSLYITAMRSPWDFCLSCCSGLGHFYSSTPEAPILPQTALREMT